MQVLATHSYALAKLCTCLFLKLTLKVKTIKNFSHQIFVQQQLKSCDQLDKWNITYLHVDRLSDGFGRVKPGRFHLGLDLSEVTVTGVRKSLTMKKSLECDHGFGEQRHVCENAYLQDTPVNTALKVTTHEGRKVQVQGQQGQHLYQTTHALHRVESKYQFGVAHVPMVTKMCTEILEGEMAEYMTLWTKSFHQTDQVIPVYNP